MAVDMFPQLTSEHWLVLFYASVLVIATVLVHYEAFSLVSRWLVRLPFHGRGRVLFVMFGLLAAHIAEIWAFGLAYWLLLTQTSLGRLTGGIADFADCIYFSSVTYTTLGYGDLSPEGPLRLLASSEALTGFVLITWSASFTFLQMERFWRSR